MSPSSKRRIYYVDPLAPSLHIENHPHGYYSELIKRINVAQTSIVLSGLYFGGHPSASKGLEKSNGLADALIAAATRGVNVRVMCDANRAIQGHRMKVVSNRNGNLKPKIRRRMLEASSNGSRQGPFGLGCPAIVRTASTVMYSLHERLTRQRNQRILAYSQSPYWDPLYRIASHPNPKLSVALVRPPPPRSIIGIGHRIALLMPRVMQTIRATFHVKINIIDNTVLMTGANLGEEYFRDRQDRYIFANAPELASALKAWTEFIAPCPVYQDVQIPQNMKTKKKRSKTKCRQYENSRIHEYTLSLKNLKQSELLLDHVHSNKDRLLRERRRRNGCPPSTIIFPRLTHWSLKDAKDHWTSNMVLDRTVRTVGPPTLFATSYFNPTPDMMRLMKQWTDRENTNNRPRAAPSILLSGPKSFSFNKGMKRVIPILYRSMTLSKARSRKLKDWRLWEHNEPRMKFHAKGMWWVPELPMDRTQSSEMKAFTDIGSSNYGTRSERRDLELNYFIKARSPVDVHAIIRESRELTKSVHQVDTSLHGFREHLSSSVMTVATWLTSSWM